MYTKHHASILQETRSTHKIESLNARNLESECLDAKVYTDKEVTQKVYTAGSTQQQRRGIIWSGVERMVQILVALVHTRDKKTQRRRKRDVNNKDNNDMNITQPHMHTAFHLVMTGGPNQVDGPHAATACVHASFSLYICIVFFFCVCLCSCRSGR